MKKSEPSGGSPRTLKAHLLIVEARFYEDMAEELARGAESALATAGSTYERIAVPGALEIPGAIVKAHRTGRYDGYVALGVVLRGETSHYDIVAHESARGLMDLTLQGLSIGNGIVTCETADQAWSRVRVAGMNKGGAAAQAALAMIAIDRMLKERA
jgi:6,7-dimethyl-8-ribityllumazine synthase